MFRTRFKFDNDVANACVLYFKKKIMQIFYNEARKYTNIMHQQKSFIYLIFKKSVNKYTSYTAYFF